MDQQPSPHWIKQPAPIYEFTPMMRYSGRGGDFEQFPTTREAGCLDAPEILPAGALQRYITAERDLGWPKQVVCTR